ncbi:uncharacterized protein LOC133034936 [Cannabis sativa]|uniref:Uncharacterized protein n=1 Tax=Cannabis sativa TaxID=3483 RepID=A0A7J6FUM6_CANSA|nr:uncharacterized protein LOC133034936 [Cannabis sativa]KAF4374405.1 hypothetical protein G4B88_026292 [Cannabis sativa]
MLDTMIPSCFSQPNTPTSSTTTSSHVPNQNLITCIYQTQLCNSPTYLTLTWSKSTFTHSLTIYAPDLFSITIPLQPSTFSLFGARPGSKSIYLTHQHSQKIKLYWDFTRAEFATNSAEPDSSFYVAITCNAKLEFFLGDLLDELTQRSGLVTRTQVLPIIPALLSRREHVFGRRNYASRAMFLGSKHEIGIECGGGTLKVKVDGETSLVVKRLAWKFRGNEKIYVGEIEVEFFWDVFNWVSNGNNGNGHGVFVFQVGDGGVWPEMVGPEKRLLRKSLSSATAPAGSSASMAASSSNSPSCSSVLQWAEESSDGGRSSSSSSTRSCSTGSNGGFSLLLYAWRKD